MSEPDATPSRSGSGGGRSPLREWRRDPEEGKIGGVCAGLASQLDFNVTAIRAVFVLVAILPGFHAFGLLLYLVLWLLMPGRAGEPSALDRVVEAGSNLVGDAFGRDEERSKRSRDDAEL